jgi:hypothetical protein
LQIVYDKVKAATADTSLKTEYLKSLLVAAEKVGQKIKR